VNSILLQLDDGLYRMQESLRSLLRNLPMRPLAWVLRHLIFPTGLPYVEPDDKKGHQAARLLLRPSEARDRLTADIYTNNDPAMAVGRHELALVMAEKVAPIEKALSQARRDGLITGKTIYELAADAQEKNIIQEEEVALLKEMEELRSQVIQVDAFDDFSAK